MAHMTPGSLTLSLLRVPSIIYNPKLPKFTLGFSVWGLGFRWRKPSKTLSPLSPRNHTIEGPKVVQDVVQILHNFFYTKFP